MSAVIVWNSIYYFILHYPFHLYLDIAYTLIVAILVWWLASYYDRSKVLLHELKEKEKSYIQLLDTAYYVNDNINQIIYEMNQEFVIKNLNPAWEKITNFSVKTSIGEYFGNFIHCEDSKKIIDSIEDCIKEKKQNYRGEMRLRKNNGNYIWVENNIKLNYRSNDQISMIGTMYDITERKISEQRLLQMNEDLSIHSEKLSAVAQLSASVVHEVRNPLTSIKGFLQLIKERKTVDDEYFHIIFSEIERIELVLSELLLLSKPNAISFKEFNIVKTIEYVIALTSSKAHMNNIELKYYKVDSPVLVFGDENQIKQVLINILKNAFEAMENGGLVEVSVQVSTANVTIYITDYGPGIPEEVLKHIGKPFYTTKENGTGLGLMTSYKIIKNHHGQIFIHSQLGIGTTFEIILPLILKGNNKKTDEIQVMEM